MSGPAKPNARLAAKLLAIVVVMVGLSFAAVPFYSWFCQVTGFAGTPQTASGATGEVLDQTITIRFDANTDRSLPWEFKPVENEVTLRIGETGMAFYEVYNASDRTIAGTASFNVSPDIAGAYFTKIDCFCFTEQVLKPGERAQLPVTFYVDPEITRDSNTARVRHITLSYTFFETKLPEAQAELSPAPKATYN